MAIKTAVILMCLVIFIYIVVTLYFFICNFSAVINKVFILFFLSRPTIDTRRIELAFVFVLYNLHQCIYTSSDNCEGECVTSVRAVRNGGSQDDAASSSREDVSDNCPVIPLVSAWLNTTELMD